MPSHIRYVKNVTFFDVIDTEPKAYWLGLLYADGNNNGRGLSLGLKAADRDHLDAFADIMFVGLRPTLKHSKAPAMILGKEVMNQAGSYKVQVYSEHISRALSRLGCVPAKSAILTFPSAEQVPSHLLRHFIRGYFDGDGSIGFYEQAGYMRAKLSVIASPAFAEALQNVLLSMGYRALRRKQRTMETVTVNGNAAVDSLCAWLYDGATVALPRKERIWREIKAHNAKTVPYKRHSKHANITYDRSAKRWIARVRRNGRLIYVGKGTTELEAYQKQQAYLASQ